MQGPAFGREIGLRIPIQREIRRLVAPPVAATRFWLHLGANVAARDWHELPGKWAPLPSDDSQRILSIIPDLLPLTRAIFAGQIGYEAPSAVLSAGELDEVIKAVAGKPA